MTYLVLAMCAIGPIGCIWELFIWNKGICKASGRKWCLFDYDSTGARGYSDGAGNTCWISWPVDGVKK